nr:GAF and ANTAR domain-containing protein [Catellatospora sichuanensis]
MHRLCSAAARALSASGTGLTVMADSGLRGVTAASDAPTERLEELQLTLGEGPCIDAYGSMRPVLVPDLADGAMTRWPVYAPAVHAEGVRAVFAFPLQVGAARLGVMDVFRSETGMLSPDELTLALTFAEIAVATLLDGHDRGGAADGWLDDPLGSRAELFQAQGMVMVQLRVSLAEAMVRMRAHAFVHDLRLYDVAADVVARRLSFDTPQP